MCFWRRTTEVQYHSHDIKSRVHIITWLITLDVDLNHMVDSVLVRFLYHKVILLLHSLWCPLWKDVTDYSPSLGCRVIYVPSPSLWGCSIHYNYWKSFYKVYRSALFHLLNYLLDVEHCRDYVVECLNFVVSLWKVRLCFWRQLLVE